MRQAVAVVALSTILTGCVVGPNYRLPSEAAINQDVAKQPLLDAKGYTTDSQSPPPNWWKLYDDPVLNDMVQRALQQNTDLRVAMANLERARAGVQFADEQGGFSGGVSALQERTQEAGEQYLLPEKVPVTNASNFGINVTYEIDLFGTLKRGVEAAKADSDAALAAKDVARVAVVSDVVHAYVENCGSGAELSVARQAVAEQQSRGDLIARLHALGRADVSETSRQETAIREIEATIPKYSARQHIAQYRLAALLAESPAELPETVRECTRLPQLESKIPIGDGTALLKRRPDVRESERKLAASTARIGVSIGALYPNVILGASTGLTGETGDLGMGSTARWSVGPMISWTFPVNGARARISEARAEQRAALASFDGVVLQALKEVQSSLAGYEASMDQLNALERAHASAVESASDAHRMFVGGRATYLDDLDASRTLTANELRLTESKVDVAMSQVDLFKSLGGGWETSSDMITPATASR
ncbi:efflux transporter outer membrane subunit [Paraburkholderia phytofirmans]|uniref:RND transporter n=1 Tax=Paraburkholderia phytofirmans OLGA172 TaxID=1417228 RepID=A0A160FVS2_9BURK|nr:efflux transporter outer membrane subunit [Paraburkholderia phytofirmans]ANB77440.1 RND transporter [Paraburkholderia phytofirmans OLGA172]